MKVILIGFMGSGKSTLSRALARKIGARVIEMDHELVKISGFKSIPEIFSKKGETFFRELELQVAKDISHHDGVVISTGGGVVMNKLTMDYLQKNGVTVFLKASFDGIKDRIKNVEERPLFKDQSSAQSLYKLRAPLYEYYSDYLIETDNKPVKEIVRDILNHLEAKI